MTPVSHSGTRRCRCTIPGQFQRRVYGVRCWISSDVWRRAGDLPGGFRRHPASGQASIRSRYGVRQRCVQCRLGARCFCTCEGECDARSGGHKAVFAGQDDQTAIIGAFHTPNRSGRGPGAGVFARRLAASCHGIGMDGEIPSLERLLGPRRYRRTLSRQAPVSRRPWARTGR